jgi:MFS family permease
VLRVLAPYRSILGVPGALAFSSTGLLARLEMAMISLGSVLLVQRETGSYALGGAVAATFGLSSAVLSPWEARLIDRYGQRRVLRLAAPVHAVMVVGIVLAAVLAAPPALLFVAAALAGATAMPVGGMVRARWALLVGGSHRLHTAFTFESVLDEVVFIVGPIVVALLATLVHPAVGLVLAAATALAGQYLLAMQRRTEPRVASAAEHAEHGRGSVLGMRGMVVLALVFLAAGSVFGSAEVTVAAVTRAAGVPAAAGLVLSLWAAGSMLSGLVYGAVRWRSRTDRRFLAAVVLFAALTAPMLLPLGVPGLAAVFLLAGVAIAPVLATGATLVEALVPSGRLTEGLAWTGTALSLTYALSAALAGVLIDEVGPSAGFLVPTVSAVLAAVVVLLGAARLQPGDQGRRHPETASAEG